MAGRNLLKNKSAQEGLHLHESAVSTVRQSRFLLHHLAKEQPQK